MTETSKFRVILRRLVMGGMLVVTVLIALAWILSHQRSDEVVWANSQAGEDWVTVDGWGCIAGRGGIRLFAETIHTTRESRMNRLMPLVNGVRQPYRDGHRVRSNNAYPFLDYGDRYLRTLGIQAVVDRWSAEEDRGRVASLTLPFWLVFAIALSGPVILHLRGVMVQQRMERVAMGLCPTCGTPMDDELSRCPRCL